MELSNPLVGTILYILYIVTGFLAIVWVFTFFGLFVFCVDSPLWVRYVVCVFDSFCAIMITYEWIYRAYNQIYKQK